MSQAALHLLALSPTGEAPQAALDRAEAVLGPDERALLARYTFPKRRADWLLGRLAAKEAVRAAGQADWALEAIAVTPLPGGRPTFTAPGGALADWRVSISHGHGRAGAIVAPGPVGLDLEQFRSIPEKGWRFFLGPEEREWLAAEPLGPQGEIVVWALKEAAYKALEGAIRHVLQLRVTHLEDGAARLSYAGGVVSARYTRLDGAVLAIATPEPAAWWDSLRLQ
ncbi:MAG: 4'-phosphopantetheinyl transferase family protein [Candidatus Sericytochromatia bacterium]